FDIYRIERFQSQFNVIFQHLSITGSSAAFRVPVSDHSLHLSKAKISKPAPHWEGTAVINGEFKELKLSDYKGKYLVFFFYPLDFTFVCPTEIIAFSDRVHEFQAINTEVVACSVDSQFTHLAWINTPRKQGGLGEMKIPLLSDLTHQISKDYGVYLEDQGHTLRYRQSRGLFIIDDKGILRQITMNDLPVGRSVDETLRLVQAFQYTDKHGEVCPAGWKPGSDTVIRSCSTFSLFKYSYTKSCTIQAYR
uniref:thioredoxin-dependent peroxiredoxin n=1 Tax=Neogobius melanostomus TaxID=47308 RepID=A0A8C6SVM0_9GOBI